MTPRSQTAQAASARSGRPERVDSGAVAKVFADVFELQSVDGEDDFFALGGDSLVAAALISEIERRFGIGLSISILMEAPTPAALAAALLDATRDRFSRTLVPVQTYGKGPTVFCVHGLDGESFFPHRLKDALGQDRPIYGFRAYGLEEGESPYATVEAIAGSYVVTAIETQPEGPYIVLGHCGIGAMIAWEMARGLLASGRQVTGLIVLDPAVTEDRAPFLHKSGLALELSRSAWAKRGLEFVADAAEQRDTTAEARRRRVATALMVALPNYVPARIECPVLLLCVADRKELLLNPERGYRNLAADLEVFTVDTNHLDLFGSQFANVVGAIGRFLDRVAPLDAERRIVPTAASSLAANRHAPE
jgi:thioesterase domain-containing protein/acyl carrier protein